MNIRTVEENFKFRLVLDITEINFENIKQWLKDLVFFKPLKMDGQILSKLKTWRYNEQKLLEFIEKELADDLSLRIHLDNGNNSLTICKLTTKVWISGSLDKQIFDENKGELCLEIDKAFQKYNGIVAYGCSGKDWFFQNITDPDWYPVYGKSTVGLPLIKSRQLSNRFEVDIEVFPGHEHTPHELWFGSCWSMWFGKKIYHLFSKESFLNFNNCFENKVLDDGSIKIQLYDSVWDYENKINRERQLDFRRNLGIDIVAHKLVETRMFVDNLNPSIELSTGEFEHGGIRLAKSYHNERGDLVPASRAAECRTLEYTKDGHVVWSKVKKL